MTEYEVLISQKVRVDAVSSKDASELAHEYIRALDRGVTRPEGLGLSLWTRVVRPLVDEPSAHFSRDDG